MSPFYIVIHLAPSVAVYRSPSMKTFLSSYANQTTCSFAFFQTMMPLGKQGLKIIIPHFHSIKREIFFCITACRHFPYPKLSAGILPRAPESLVHRSTSTYFEWDANMVYFQQIGIMLKYPVNIADRLIILDFIIHMKYSDFSLDIVFLHILQTKIEHNTTVFTAGKRNIDVIKLVKQYFYPVHCPFIDVFFHLRQLSF